MICTNIKINDKINIIVVVAVNQFSGFFKNNPLDNK